MELLRFTVRNQRLSGGRVRLVSDSVDYVEAFFDFRTDEWEGLSKWAHFEKGEAVYDLNLVEDKITADMHLNLEAGTWEVKLHGTDSEGTKRITTDTAFVIVEAYGEGFNPLPEIPLTAAEQIDAKSQLALDTANAASGNASEAIAKATEIYEAAARGDFNGKDGEKGDPGITPEIQIGNVETLGPGEEAAVTIGGTVEKPILNFAIPQGERGNGIENVTVEQSLEDGGFNSVEFILTDGERYGLAIMNGNKGNDGKSGSPGLIWQGEWNPETSYTAIKNGQISRDVVFYNGSAYVVAANSPAPVVGIVPEGDTSGKWELLTSKGDKGDKGEKGDGGTAERLSGSTLEITPENVLAAINEGKALLISHTDETYGIFKFSEFTVSEELDVVFASDYLTAQFGIFGISLIGSLRDNAWHFYFEELAGKDDIPESMELSVFDLAEMGLDAIPITGGSGVLQTDTAEILEALSKGPVGFVVPINMGAVVNATIIMNGAGVNGSYQCISMVNYVEPATVTVNVEATGIQVILASLKDSVGLKTAASVDLSGFESGTVIETYSDGSTKTYTFEFDSDGNPVKITDSDGNETVLTW